MRRLLPALSLLALPLLGGCTPSKLAYATADGAFASAGYVEGTATLDNGAMHYWDGGEGPPVVLLHGFGGNAAIQWDRQARVFARDHRVVMPDLLFFGDSTTHRPERSPEFQAQTVVQLLDHLAVEGPVDLVGVSYGGFIAWAIAAMYPDRVGKVVIVDSPGPVYTAADMQRALDHFGVESVHDLLLPDTPEDVRRILEVVKDPPPPVPTWALRDVLRSFQRADRRHQIELMDALQGRMGGDPGQFPSPTQPTLLVWGAEDMLFPVDVARRLEAHIGDNASLHVIEGTAHGPNKFAAREFNRVVRAFLAPDAAPAAEAPQ
jgi:pimeloyl-ACP methyl ester carboxylesterase